MTYDPSESPRWIPPDTPGVDPDTSLIEDRISDLHQAIDACRQMLDLFSSPAWDLVDRLVRVSISQADDVLRKEHDMAEWKFVRGQVVTYEWLLELPATIRKQYDQTIAQVRSLEERIPSNESA